MKFENRRGFTLIELLVVIAIIVLVAGFTLPALTGITKGNGLNNGGRILANLLTVARSEAINRGALIRFEVATSWPSDPASAYRKITLVQRDSTTGTDTQLTRWETLPIGVTFDPNDPGGTTAGKYFFVLNQTQTPKLKFAGNDVDTLYVEFLPTGALNVALQDSPVRLRLVSGVFSGSQIIATGGSNYFDTSVDALVGRIAISRP